MYANKTHKVNNSRTTITRMLYLCNLFLYEYKLILKSLQKTLIDLANCVKDYYNASI